MDLLIQKLLDNAYEQMVAELEDENKFNTIFHEIDGSLQIEEITEKIKQILKKS